MNPPGNSVPSLQGSPEPRIDDKTRRLITERSHRRSQDLWLRGSEMVLWLTAGISFYCYRYNSQLTPSPASTLADLFAASLIVLIPILFQLVFQALPLELVRLRFSRRGSQMPFAKELTAATPWVGSADDKTPGFFATLLLLKKMAETSDTIAERIYTRAGVYLLFGVLIAFSGLIFFYIETRESSSPSIPTTYHGSPNERDAPQRPERAEPTPWENLTKQAPGMVGRLGVLFFIELVAFFFLRQYRAVMDEYRYFEAIKRRREENLATTSMLFQSSGEKIDFFSFISKCSLYSDAPRLSASETTEILETRKLTKDEAALFEKMIDAVAKIRA